MREDSGLKLKYINTKNQVADIFIRGLFTAQQWSHLVFLSGIGVSKVSCISHEHVPLINVDMIEKGTACKVSCIERHVDIFDELDEYDEGEARASQKADTSS
jgi:hypothetical protein